MRPHVDEEAYSIKILRKNLKSLRILPVPKHHTAQRVLGYGHSHTAAEQKRRMTVFGNESAVHLSPDCLKI